MATGRRGKGEGSTTAGVTASGSELRTSDSQGGRRRRKAVYGKTQKEVRDKLRALQRTVTLDRYRHRRT